MAAVPARERILRTAADLFYEEGVRAVGIDRIIATSGIAKMTLYRHFPSKDDLVVAYLEAREAEHQAWVAEVLARHPGEPRQQLLDLVDALAAGLEAPGYRGCAFANVSTEFPDPSHPGRRVALEHTRRQRALFADLAAAAGAADPAALGDALLLIGDGAHQLCQLVGGPEAAARTRGAAWALVNWALPVSAVGRPHPVSPPAGRRARPRTRR